MSTAPDSRSHASKDESGAEVWERTNDALDVVDRWRARVDELRVQLDLAKLELRENTSRQLDLARNANLAASSKLQDAYHDATETAEALRDGVDELLRDVKKAFEAVQDVFSRT